MNAILRRIMERAESWPEELQKEAVRSLLELEESRAGPYAVSDAEWADIEIGLEQAERGDFVSEVELGVFERQRPG